MLDGLPVIIRDQDRLRLGQVEFSDNVTLESYVKYLNQWVYFWPGDHQGPRQNARALAEANDDEQIVVVRVPFNRLVQLNPACPPHFAACNSGSPRFSGGRPAKRDHSTHRRPGAFQGTASTVVEVAFKDRAALPEVTELAVDCGGPWFPLFRQN